MSRGSGINFHVETKPRHMFIALDGTGAERLLIFGAVEGTPTGDGGRMHAERLVIEMCEKVLHDDDTRRARGRAILKRGANELADISTTTDATWWCIYTYINKQIYIYILYIGIYIYVYICIYVCE